MGKKSFTQQPVKTNNVALLQEMQEMQAFLGENHPRLQAMRRASRTPLQAAAAEAKKKRSRAKNKAARAARKKSR